MVRKAANRPLRTPRKLTAAPRPRTVFGAEDEGPPLRTRSTEKFPGQAGFYLIFSTGDGPGEPHAIPVSLVSVGKMREPVGLPTCPRMWRLECILGSKSVRPTAALQHFGALSAVSNGVLLVSLTVLVIEIWQLTLPSNKKTMWYIQHVQYSDWLYERGMLEKKEHVLVI